MNYADKLESLIDAIYEHGNGLFIADPKSLSIELVLIDGDWERDGGNEIIRESGLGKPDGFYCDLEEKTDSAYWAI